MQFVGGLSDLRGDDVGRSDRVRDLTSLGDRRGGGAGLGDRGYGFGNRDGRCGGVIGLGGRGRSSSGLGDRRDGGVGLGDRGRGLTGLGDRHGGGVGPALVVLERNWPLPSSVAQPAPNMACVFTNPMHPEVPCPRVCPLKYSAAGRPCKVGMNRAGTAVSLD